MRVTAKGQVTIPKDIRDKLGIGPGSEVEFVATEDAVELRAASPEAQGAARKAALEAAIARFTGTMDLDGLTVDDFMATIRDTDIPDPAHNDDTR